MDIFFRFENTNYRVSFDAYEKGRIVLPDGRLFNVIWEETCPPRVLELVPIEHNYQYAAANVIASLFRAERAIAY